MVSISLDLTKKTILITLTILIAQSTCFNISDQSTTYEGLVERLDKFNKFYHELNPTSINLELKHFYGKVRLVSTKELEEKENYLSIKPNQMITQDYIYTTKYGKTFMEIEEVYGFDDLLNFAFSILHEYFEPDAKWKPYIDTLPFQPRNTVYDFWNTKKWAEPILKGTSVISKFD
jgi:hypothetical protein